MPKALENKLMHQADNQGLKGNQKEAYVYGTLRKAGWEPKSERKKRQVDAFATALRSMK